MWSNLDDENTRQYLVSHNMSSPVLHTVIVTCVQQLVISCYRLTSRLLAEEPSPSA